MTFSIPDYSNESKQSPSSYTKTESAGQRYGSNINVITINGEAFVLGTDTTFSLKVRFFIPTTFF
jgi:hypothetical protein